MTGSLLPHALLDFTVARASAHLETLAYPSLRRGTLSLGRRFAHQSVSLENLTAPGYVSLEGENDRSLYSRRQTSRQRMSALASAGLFPHSQGHPLTELERRIAELKEAPIAEIPQESAPSYSDAELIAMYEDLLAVPSVTQQQDNAVVDPEAQGQFDKDTLHGTLEALYALEDPSAIPTDIKSQYGATLSKLREIVDALELARDTSGALPAGISILSEQEWVSLVRICVEEQDGQAAESAIDFMKRSGATVPEVVLETAMALYADAGDVVNAERFLASFAGPSPPEQLRDLHIKTHLRAIEPRTFPTKALTVLHKYETIGVPAPQRSYTRLINSLLSVRSTVAEAQAWDLFSHMRYVAHPNPDAYLYARMISACASRVIAPQPARALDLFTEMTVDKRIPPTAAAYAAAIYACARSGQKLYVGEAFRLAKEMLDGNRDAYGNPAFAPDRMTFRALLEGAKRLGDLGKVRWILAEIVADGLRTSRGDVRNAVVVNEEVMMHVFHAYAAYKVPFNRADTVLVDEDAATTASSIQLDADSSVAGTASNSQRAEDVSVGETPNVESAEPEHPQPPVVPQHSQFTTVLPQSHPEVLSEIRALFSRIIYDAAPSLQNTSAHIMDDIDSTMPHAFQHVQLTPRLLNSYLSVHYAHALFDESVNLYRTLFSELKIERNAITYVEALERAAYAERRWERTQALKFAREVWPEWQLVEEAWWRKEKNDAKVNPRLVERAYTAMIRVLSLTGHLSEAVQLVRTFVDRYPPEVIKKANPKHALRSTRTILQASRPLVRLISSTEIPDDTVPPLLSFPELEVLHHRLVVRGDKESIGYLKYVCMAYAGALKKRKEATLRAVPVKEEDATLEGESGATMG